MRQLEAALTQADGTGEAPRSCPKISLSRNPSGMAAQLIATKGDEARGLSVWIAAATNSFPVPDSP